MAKNRIIYIFSIVACVAFSMAYTSKISVMLLSTMLLYPVLALIFTFVQVLSIKAEFTDNRLIVEKQSRFEVCINLKNTFVFPCVPLELECSLPDADAGVFCGRRIYASLSPFGQAKLSIACKHIYRGCYGCRINRVAAIDPLRIIRVSKKIGSEMPLICLPRKIELADILSAASGERDITLKNASSLEREDFSHVRDYRDGDIIQLVHWKLTAKQDELMIKQFDSAIDRRALILCDFNSYPDDRDPLLRTDTIIETAIAFVKSALDNGIGSSVDIGRVTDRDGICVANMTDFNRFFEFMSVIPTEFDMCDFPLLIDNADKSGASVLVLITSELNDGIIARAKAAAKQRGTFLAYINLFGKPLEDNFSEEAFVFLNIRGTGADALNSAAEQILENAGG